LSASPQGALQTTVTIFERLGAEHGFAGGYTTANDYVREHRARAREMVLPLSHTKSG
jgi:hypothetical protein